MSLFAALLAVAPPALPAPALTQDVLSLYMDHTDALLKHPKDQGLHRVMDHLGARLLELPGEIRELREIPPQLIPMTYEMVRSAKTLRILDARETNPMIPLSLQLQVAPKNAAHAGEWMTTLEGMMRQAGAPLGARDADGWLPIEGLPLPIRMGTPSDVLVLTAGEPELGPMDLTGAELPGGVAPSFAMQMNLGTLLEMFLPMMEQAEPEMAGIVMDITNATGLDDFSFTMACGSDAQKGYTVSRIPGWGANLRSKGALPVEGLTAADLALLPADATVAQIQSIDLHAMFDMVLGLVEPYLAEEGFDRPLERIEEMVGVHIERDILDHLGTHVGSYMSDTTGGGGMLSTVIFIEAKDPAQLEQGLMRISGLINGALAGQVDGYVQMRTLQRQGRTCHTLTFPGLPVPIEPTLIMGQNNLFIGFTPQAALAGVAQESGAQANLSTHPDFLASFDGNYSNLYAVNYFAKEAFIRDGYGLTSMLCSGLSNGVRSPMDPERDAGLVMPTFPELIEGVRATVSITRIEANGDLVTRVESDPSVLVGLTRVVGYVAGNPAMLLAFMGPAIAVGGFDREIESMVEDAVGSGW